MISVISFLLGVVLMAIGTYFMVQHKKELLFLKEVEHQRLESELEVSQSSLKNVQEELVQEKIKLSETETLYKETDQRLSEVQGEKNSWEKEANNLRNQLQDAHTDIKIQQNKLNDKVQQLEEQRDFLNTADEHLKASFLALSGQTLKTVQTQFLQLAQNNFKQHSEQQQQELNLRKQEVEALVTPMRESLTQLNKNIQELEVKRTEAYAGLLNQVDFLTQGQTSLQKETRKLVTALKTPTGRGQWGEMQLKRVVEMAGMVDHCDFVTQESHDKDEGKKIRPDMIVNLPDNRHIIVDSKASMDAYLKSIECEDEEQKRELLQQHAKQVETQIRNLSSKSYWSNLDCTPEFVVLFLPSESFFQAALEANPSLIELGVNNKIILSTPTTLIALLRAVAYGWNQAALAQNAAQIAEAGSELYERSCIFSEHFAQIGKSLQSSVDAYNKSVNSYESRFKKSAIRLKDLGISSKRELKEIKQVTELTYNS